MLSFLLLSCLAPDFDLDLDLDFDLDLDLDLDFDLEGDSSLLDLLALLDRLFDRLGLSGRHEEDFWWRR